jgi:NAD(P)-dependent dehydrogenase (short-subunit alcohol dehydrogenase family)
VIDFSDMESVRIAAAEAMNRFPKIHGLILSAVAPIALVQNGPIILPNGHEVLFATNVMGPFLFTQLLIERMQQSDGLVLHVVAPHHKEIDWDNLESIINHKAGVAFNRTKTCNRMIAAELARRYAGRISSVAFNPSFIIDKTDPELKKRWPSGFMGLFWRLMTVLFAKPPVVAGEPIANLMLAYEDRSAINGALFKLDTRVEKPDKAMNDGVSGKRLWDKLVLLTGLTDE